ncbi:MAG: lmo0937 family membrane protein [Candidatus Paceibacterota bacterium]
MIWTLIIVLFVLWLLGFTFNFGGNLIHTLLVIALVALIIRLLS